MEILLVLSGSRSRQYGPEKFLITTKNEQEIDDLLSCDHTFDDEDQADGEFPEIERVLIGIRGKWAKNEVYRSPSRPVRVVVMDLF